MNNRFTQQLSWLIYGFMGCILTACSSSQSPQEVAARADEFIPLVSKANAESSIANDKQWMPNCDKDIAAIEASIAELEIITPPYSVKHVLVPLNHIETAIADGASFASLMESVHPNSTVRDHTSKCTSAYADLATRLSLSRPIYEAVSRVDVSNSPADSQRYQQLSLQDYRLSGVDKSADIRQRLRALNDDITQLGQQFDKNILEDVRTLEVLPKELAGLPDDFIQAKTIGLNGKVKLTTRYVDTIPVYTYLHSDKIRQQLRQLDRSRGYPKNKAVLKEMLRLRHEMAQLLGFEHYADLITSDKMIGSAANAQAFIDRIHQLAAPVAAADKEQLLGLLQTNTPTAKDVERWQTMFLEEQIRRTDYNVDTSTLRQYFPYHRVRDGIFALTEHLFDVDIKPWQTEVWHETVQSFEMYQGDELIGRFHLDMHPREGKYQHAAAFTVQTGIADQQLPISTLVCNFAGGNDPNEPMEFSQVNTFLHEFGHLLHSLFGGHQRYARLSGIATEWDFVEAPSQMLEEWLYDSDTLKSFAINAEGKVIPDDLITKVKATRHFGNGSQTSVQLYYAALSLQYHAQNPADFDLEAKMIALENQYSPFPHQNDTYFFANLGHLNGYSAIYYTYMWSKVIAMDMFSQFESNGLRDKSTAKRYRNAVLAPGGSQPAAALVEEFLGRPYNFEAFSDWLTAASNNANPKN